PDRGRRRPPAAGVPRRADRRDGPTGPPDHLGPGPRPGGRRGRGPTDHPRHGRGERAVRHDRDHRPGTGAPTRHRGRAHRDGPGPGGRVPRGDREPDVTPATAPAPLDLSPAGAGGPASPHGRASRAARQGLVEVRLQVRNGEQLLLSLLIPVAVLVVGRFFAGGLISFAELAPSVLALALWSSGFTAPAI